MPPRPEGVQQPRRSISDGLVLHRSWQRCLAADEERPELRGKGASAAANTAFGAAAPLAFAFAARNRSLIGTAPMLVAQ